MPRIYLSARGEPVDFDALLIKQKLAQAPVNIDVARRQAFIDSKEGRPARATPVLDAGTLDNDVSISGRPTINVIVPTDEESIASTQQGVKVDPKAKKSTNSASE